METEKEIMEKKKQELQKIKDKVLPYFKGRITTPEDITRESGLPLVEVRRAIYELEEEDWIEQVQNKVCYELKPNPPDKRKKQLENQLKKMR